ncbi:MAG: universal stress protein [Deltaproteobacteria bacterium]|nr:universal stress protein [Deltaproteobacteria bacterium]
MADKNNSKGFKKILFPTDFTDASVAAASYAMMLARQNKAKLYVLHVMDVSKEAAGFYLPHLSFERLDKEMRGVAGEMLKNFCAKQFKGFRNVEMHVLAGEPFKEILKVVKGSKIDLVVMGTFGKARVDRLLFGSTTERVVRRAECPVLVIPPSK